MSPRHVSKIPDLLGIAPACRAAQREEGPPVAHRGTLSLPGRNGDRAGGGRDQSRVTRRPASPVQEPEGPATEPPPMEAMDSAASWPVPFDTATADASIPADRKSVV